MKRLYLPHDLFELFPTEKIKASELVEGDIVKLHTSWNCTVSSKRKFDSSDEEVTVIRRDMINKEKVKELVAMHHAEMAERECWAEEEEREERERLREMRDDLNRQLGEDE